MDREDIEYMHNYAKQWNWKISIPVGDGKMIPVEGLTSLALDALRYKEALEDIAMQGDAQGKEMIQGRWLDNLGNIARTALNPGKGAPHGKE